MYTRNSFKFKWKHKLNSTKSIEFPTYLIYPLKCGKLEIHGNNENESSIQENIRSRRKRGNCFSQLLLSLKTTNIRLTLWRLSEGVGSGEGEVWSNIGEYVKVKSSKKSERQFTVGREDELHFVRGSQDSLARPPDESGVKTKTTGWLEAVA